MNRPDQSSDQRNQSTASAFEPEAKQEFFGKKQQGAGGEPVPEHADHVIRPGVKSEGRVIDRKSEPLQRPIEIRGCRINKKEMIEAFRYELPTPNQRVAQDQCGIVPDKTVAHRRGIANEDGDEKN